MRALVQVDGVLPGEDGVLVHTLILFLRHGDGGTARRRGDPEERKSEKRLFQCFAAL
jgi:hypothetical protein